MAHAMLFFPPDDRTIAGPGGTYGLYTIVSDGCLICLGPAMLEVPLSIDQLQGIFISLFCIIPVTVALSHWLLHLLNCIGTQQWTTRTHVQMATACFLLAAILLLHSLYNISSDSFCCSIMSLPVCAVMAYIFFRRNGLKNIVDRFRSTIVGFSISIVLLVLLLLTGIILAYELGEARQRVLGLPIILATGLPLVLPFFILLLLFVPVYTTKLAPLAEQSPLSTG